jgi:hypothetical protein
MVDTAATPEGDAWFERGVMSATPLISAKSEPAKST